MKNSLFLLQLSGMTSIALIGVPELTANSLAAQPTTHSQVTSVSQVASVKPDKDTSTTYSSAETYFWSDPSLLKVESQIDTLAISDPRLGSQASRYTKIGVTSPLQPALAEFLDELDQGSTTQKTHLNQIENKNSSVNSEPDTVERQVPTESDKIEREAFTISATNLPALRTTKHSAALLKQPPSVQQNDKTTIAQASEEEQFPPAKEVIPKKVDPGQSTRSGSSYIGVGANFGVGGDTSLGDSGLFVYSKVGLARYFSVRPAVNTDFEEDATFLFPLTFDLAPIAVGNTGVRIAPYFGGGPAVSTSGDFGPVISGGIDLPLNEHLTVTSGVNVGILDEADVGVFLGIGYNFPSLF